MIEAVGLTRTYGSETAVLDLSFQVRPGMVTGFMPGDGNADGVRPLVLLAVVTAAAPGAGLRGARQAGRVA